MLKVLINPRRFGLTTLVALGFAAALFAQSTNPIQLAEEYLQQGEVEKAKAEFEKLARNRQILPLIHDSYFNLLLSEKSFDEAEKYLKYAIRQLPNDFNYEVDMAVLYRTMKLEDQADKHLDQLIEEIAKDSDERQKRNNIRILAQMLFQKDFREKAIKTYEVGRKVFGDSDMFALDLATVYRVMGEKEKMIREYLHFSKTQPTSVGFVKNSLQRYLEEPEDMDLLEGVLYELIQEEAGNPVYNELLIWTHLQQKNFSAALRQARALDRRLDNRAHNILNVGIIAYENKDYKNAAKAFEYIIADFKESPNFRLAQRYSLLAEEEVIKQSYPVDTMRVRQLIGKYQSFKEESKDLFTALEAQRRIALLQAFQLNKIDTAIATLTELVQQPIGKHRILAEAKMDLADIYLLDQQPWESILLYGQVERMFKDEPLGYMAKLKSAKLSYFKGEFELAQSHLDILKLATSREIANDALDLSILIKNNTVFDSTDVVMQDYANVELMIFQNQRTEALAAMDSMLAKYDRHSITDEVLMLKAQTLRQLGEFEQALNALRLINEKYSYDILADDALYLTGVILEEDLKKSDEAMKVYNDLLTRFKGSIYVAEARNRFRTLRGDFNN
ncbi:tetratricopeptide repeat protein [Roseivirga sp. UBA1976]|uniref:tetratricopeptide repeat protein n=1 Tax=Roseivirga sp. UBA1976 TaxID=1947386 RepID=UPI00257EB06E|nr:tetratricopeptide repeat protein [Roseivirga sp. UBA1976]|tara:strand:- start:5519 stop:7372 length:1854 start_codon:yes stop_codon:yes gene_type:complete